jgi:hypothetical protein
MVFNVVEKAELPLIKSGPSRGKICVIATISSFFIALLIVLVIEYLKRAKKDSEQNEKMQRLAQWFSSRFSRVKKRG